MEKKQGSYSQRLWYTRSATMGKPPFRCPNECGFLTLLKRRQAMLHLVPEDLLEYAKGEEGEYGYLAGVCPKCGFVLVADEATWPPEEEKPKEPEIVECSCGETFDWENWDRETYPVPVGVMEAVRHLDMGHTIGLPEVSEAKVGSTPKTWVKERTVGAMSSFCPIDLETGNITTGLTYIGEPDGEIVGEFWHDENGEMIVELYPSSSCTVKKDGEVEARSYPTTESHAEPGVRRKVPMKEALE